MDSLTPCFGDCRWKKPSVVIAGRIKVEEEKRTGYGGAEDRCNREEGDRAQERV